MVAVRGLKRGCNHCPRCPLTADQDFKSGERECRSFHCYRVCRFELTKQGYAHTLFAVDNPPLIDCESGSLVEINMAANVADHMCARHTGVMCRGCCGVEDAL